VTGAVTRIDGGTVTVNLGKVEGLLPRGEQIPGDSHRVGERVRAVVMDVRKQGTRVKIILSRTHPEMVRRLFELEIPEVGENIIEVRSLAREAGYRSKVAVSCFDSKIDCVGACVGVRGSRIKSVVEELAGERIDIVRWNDSLQVLVPNALQPAEVEDVILCPMLGKVIVLVRDDQLSLAIGKKGQNVRLASKLVGWDIHVMTQERLDVQLDESVAAFSTVPGVSSELAETLVSQGFFTFEDLSVIEPDQLAELGGLTPEQCDEIVAFADAEAVRIEREERKAREEAHRLAQLQAATGAAPASAAEARAPQPAVVSDVEEAEAEPAAVEEDHSEVEGAAEEDLSQPVDAGDAGEGTSAAAQDSANGHDQTEAFHEETEALEAAEDNSPAN
jgi:N utilization substance protein A